MVITTPATGDWNWKMNIPALIVTVITPEISTP